MITFDPRGVIVINGISYPGNYSGHGEGLNNPEMEQDKGVGRLPRGIYKIGPWHYDPHLGPIVATLTMVSGNAFGRSGFYVHGDNQMVNHSASDGCIVASRAIRTAMQASGETQLQVT